jgi:hypothetical protein
MKAWVAVMVALVAAISSKQAFAQARWGSTVNPSQQQDSRRESWQSDEPRIESRWYGDETLLMDGASAAVALLAVLADDELASPILGFASIGGYVAGGPMMHVRHHAPGRALGSVALRVGLPLLGLAPALACSGRERDGCGEAIGAVLIGLPLGIGAAIAIDAAVLAREDVPVYDEHARIHFGISPLVTRTSTGVAMNVAGAF